MPTRSRAHSKHAVVGVADHAGFAIAVTVVEGTLVDRRRIALVADGLPNLPHHHDAQTLPIEEGVALVEKVRASVARHTAAELETLARQLRHPIAGVALRSYHPPLPSTVRERITNYRAQCAADSIMYRDELARAAEANDWFVEWYDAKTILSKVPRVLIDRTGKELGPPWQRDHRNAMAAAIVASTSRFG